MLSDNEIEVSVDVLVHEVLKQRLKEAANHKECNIEGNEEKKLRKALKRVVEAYEMGVL